MADWESTTFTGDEELLEPIRRPRRPGAPPPPPGRRHVRVTRRGRWVRRLVAAIAIFLAVSLVSGVAFFLYAKHKIDAKGVACSSCSAAPGGGGTAPFNILVVGSDTRAVLSPQDQQRYDPAGVDAHSGQRADTIAVLHVEPATGKAVLVNIPRDLRVPALTGGGFVKVNAYYNSGVSSMVSGIERLTGLSISHYIEVNFDSFRTITDALGGVDVYFTRSVYDANSGLKQPKGCDLVTGDQALAFVRDRDTDSDFGRIARQQLFVKLMLDKVLTPGTLLNPVRMASLINLGLGTLTHDSGLSASMMLSLARRFHNLSANNIDFRVLPSYPDNTPIGGQLYVLENTAQAGALFSALKNNTALPPYGIQGSAFIPSSVPAVVLNGTGVAGLAARGADTLTRAGFPVAATGNAPGAAATAVYYTPGNQAAAQFLQQQEYPSAEVAALPPTIALPATVTPATVDAVVVLGQNAALPGSAAGGPSAASPSAPANPLPAGPPTPVASQVLARPC
jgi:LCP family protein required for cell wall assembly